MKRTATAVLALLLTIGPATVAAAAVAPETAPWPTPVECDPDRERPAVWDQETGEVILCESRGEGPAMGPDCELVGDCPPQLPTPPALDYAAPEAPTEHPAPDVHEELAETGLSSTGVMLLAFALAAICLGCIAVIAGRRALLYRAHRFREQRRRPSIGQHFATPPLYRRRG